MDIDLLIYRIKFLALLFKKRGIKYAYNYIHIFLFYGTKNPFLIALLYWLSPYPSYIEIEVTTKCNLRCIVCEHTYWDEPIKDMSFEQFKKILDQFSKLKWIGLTGIGESFLNKDFLKMLEYVKSRNIFVELYDTFYFIDEKISAVLIDMGVDRIFASIDGATKETYEKIRVGSDFDRVINNVKNLIKIKNQKKASFLDLRFHFIITKANVQEIPDYIKLVSRLVDGKSVIIQFSRMLHEFKEVDDLFTDIPKEIIKEAEENAKKYKLLLLWNADVPLVKPKMTKCTEWLMPFIFVTGHVIPCCAGNETNMRGFQKQTSMGNIFEHNFNQIWHGQKYRALRKMLNKGNVPLACQKCCIYDNQGS